MKKIVFFSLLIAVSIWTLVFITGQRESLQKEKEKITVIESQSTSSQSPAPLEKENSPLVKTNPDFRLRILSEPEAAEVYIDSEKLGTAPFETAIPGESRKLKLVLEGYEDYERQIPALKDSEGDLVWKIQMKKSAPKKIFTYYTKEIAPFSVQLKAIPFVEFEKGTDDFSAAKAKLCRVLISSDGEEKLWVRAVLGPFPDKKKAALALKNIKKKYPDAFVTTRHKCRGD